MLAALEAVQAVQYLQLEERRIIPDHLKPSHPFSALALWTYYARTHHEPKGESCVYCKMFDGQTFTGAQLRSVFPDYMWSGDDIYPNAHKTLWGVDSTCGCLLIREPSVPEVDTNLSMWTQIGTDWIKGPDESEEYEKELEKQRYEET